RYPGLTMSLRRYGRCRRTVGNFGATRSQDPPSPAGPTGARPALLAFVSRPPAEKERRLGQPGATSRVRRAKKAPAPQPAATGRSQIQGWRSATARSTAAQAISPTVRAATATA